MGGEMLAPEPADLRVQLVDVRDLAAFVLDQVEAGTDGVFNVTGPEGVLTMSDLLGACVAAGDADTETIWVGLDFLRQRGLSEVGEHGWEQLPYWYPELAGFCAFDVSKAIPSGLRFRPLAETIADTLAWDRTRGQTWPMGAGITPERERDLLDAWRKRDE
jgi:2'-hydroxyisoflavone reductase